MRNLFKITKIDVNHKKIFIFSDKEEISFDKKELLNLMD